MSALFDSLSLQVLPNSAPTWSGTIPFTQYTQDVRVIRTSVPLTQQKVNEYVYVDLDLWVEESQVNDEKSMLLKGVPLSVREISKSHLPSVITPSLSVIQDDYEDIEDMDVITAETFGTAVYSLLAKTGWNIRLDVGQLSNYPVVTEANPAIALNGSLIEQLSELLGMFTPNDLWGQSLSFYVNIFTGDIIITSPLDSSSGATVSISDVKPIDLTVRKVYVDLPEKLHIEESETAVFRSEEHLEEFGIKTESYDTSTGSTIEEEDSDVTEISATLNGEKITLGGLLLSQQETASMSQSTLIEIANHWGGLNPGSDSYSVYLTKGKSSEVETTTKYKYMTGPPYEKSAVPWFSEPSGNHLFSKSQTGTRQQISRDLGCVKIDEDHHPEYLLTTDGIQVLGREVVSVERSVQENYFTINGVEYHFPGGVPEGDEVTTTLTEVFMYSEEGYLTGERSRKVVQNGEEFTVTETYRIISPVSDQLSSEMTFSVVSKYRGGEEAENLLETSVTDVSVQMVSAQISGPSPTSVSASSEGNQVLRNKLLISNPPVEAGPSDGEAYQEYATGTLYVTVESLTLEELEEYLKNHYVLDPKSAYYASFTSRHLDVRGALGGSVRFSFDSSPNSGMIIGEDRESIDQHYSMLEDAMAIRSFRITGLTMDWEGSSVPEISVAMCQLV